MKIIVNGNEKAVDVGTSIVMLLHQYNIQSPMTIVEVNQTVVSKDQWDTHVLNEGDQIELIQLMGGG